IANLIKGLNLPLDLDKMSAKDMDDLLAFAFDRYFETSALFGTVASCASLVEQLKRIGVDEIACLFDFGVSTEASLAALNHLKDLKAVCNNRLPAVNDRPIPDRSSDRPTLLQCTPSMMRMLMQDPAAIKALQPLRALLLGG